MAHSPAFRYWVAVQTGRRKSDEQLLAEIEAELNDPAVTRTEVRGPSGWEVVA